MSAKLACALALLLIAIASAEKQAKPKRRVNHDEDAFSLLDRHMAFALSHDRSLLPQLAHQYLWPWTKLAEAVAALDDEESLEATRVRTDPRRFEIRLDVRRFAPDEISVKVQDRTVVVEGKRSVEDAMLKRKYVANHFVQRFELPLGCEPGEVTALLKANGVLSVSAPRHVPPPPPERVVPVLVETVEVAPTPAAEDSRPVVVEKRPGELPTEPTVDVISLDVKPADLPVEKRPPQGAATETSEETISSKETAGPKETDGSKEATAGSKEIPSSKYSSELSPVTDAALPVETTAYVGKIRKKELKNATKDAKKNDTKKPMENNVLDYANLDSE